MPAEREGRRIGVLWVPDWPIAAAVAEGVLPGHLPAALAGGTGLVAVSAQARRLGLAPGMTRRTAQALVPDLALADADELRDVRSFEAVLAEVELVVADVALLRPGLMLVPLAGAVRYYQGEEPVAEALTGAAARAGAESQVGTGGGLLAAILAARESQLIPTGEAARFLAGRPVGDVTHAALTQRVRTAYADLVGVLRRLGIDTLGSFARLTPGEVGARFGQVGLDAHRLARGVDVPISGAYRPEADISAGIDLDPPVERVEAAAFAAHELAQIVQSRLVRRGVVSERIRVEARAENGAHLSRTWRSGGLHGAAELTDRVRWQLAGWLDGRSGDPPSAPLVRLDLIAENVSPAGANSTGLWGARSRGRDQATRAAERVQAMLGPEGVMTAVLEGGRTPRGRIRYVAWGDDTQARRDPDAPWPGQLPSPLPTTLLAETVPAEVTDSGGAAVGVNERGCLSAAPALVRLGASVYPVREWAGPWRIRERWWSGMVGEVYLQVVCDQVGALLLRASEPDPGVISAQGAAMWVVEGRYD